VVDGLAACLMSGCLNASAQEQQGHQCMIARDLSLDQLFVLFAKRYTLCKDQALFAEIA